MIDKSGHDEKLDIWCIGVLVYELLTGRTPFMGTSDNAVKNSQALYDNILNVRIEFP
jgi:serine/threonine protein kinase